MIIIIIIINIISSDSSASLIILWRVILVHRGDESVCWVMQ